MREVEILKTAKAKLEKGWCQTYLRRMTTTENYCLVGSINWRQGRNVTDVEEKSSMGYIYRAIFGSVGCSVGAICAIETWNDKRGRKKEEILTVVDKAIELAAKDAAG